ncbi:MAG: hypothetical protein EBS01_04955, partial [Verrucomicrobia bacterium]|nr:hypothetical protein [Verrucomicrobiota bacterium]
MSHSSFQPATEFVELLSLYAAGTLDAEGSARLEALLSEARENRRFFRRYLRADTALRESACG